MMEKPDHRQVLKPPLRLKVAVVAGLVLAIAAAWVILDQLGMPDQLTPSALAAWLSGRGLWGPLLLGLMMIIAVVVGPIPTLPISAASGLAFGVVGGTVIAALGALVGAVIAFLASRLLARDFIRDRFRGNPVLAMNAPQRVLFWFVFFTRLVPVFSFALISYAAGLTAISVGRFMLATFVGMLPMTLVFAGFGQTFRFHPVMTVTAAVVLLAAMTWLPYYLKQHSDLFERYFGKESEK